MKLESTNFLVTCVYSDNETRFHKSMLIGSNVALLDGGDGRGQTPLAKHVNLVI
jgi:hypothetical protein